MKDGTRGPRSAAEVAESFAKMREDTDLAFASLLNVKLHIKRMVARGEMPRAEHDRVMARVDAALDAIGAIDAARTSSCAALHVVRSEP